MGFVAVAVYFAVAHATWRLIFLGLPVALVGVAVRAWASGHLRKNARLAVSGPYAFTRNPLYFGSFLMLGGALISGGSVLLAVALLTLFLLVYYPVMQREALHMQTLFGKEYEVWAASVPLFFPRLSPWRAAVPEGFDWDLYLKHREYRAMVGVLVLYSAVALKYLFLAK